MMAMAYGSAYVARVAMGAKDAQTVKAFVEAENYPGTSLVIAYSHCIAHGYDLAFGLDQQRLAVESGSWPLVRFDPRRQAQGEPPLMLDSGPPKVDLAQYVRNESRYRMVEQASPSRFRELLDAARRQAAQQYARYAQLASAPQATPHERH
jgi:pyruvate-ferredoxin/flavodoxin oxidoreductase